MKKKTDPILLLLYIIIGIALIYFGAALGFAMDNAADKTGKIDFMSIDFTAALSDAEILAKSAADINTNCFQVASLTAFIYFIFIAIKYVNRLRLHRKGVEHGSSRWATDSEKKMLADKKKKIKKIALKNENGIETGAIIKVDNNIILTNEVIMSLDTRQHRENLNVLVVGGSGSGKTRFYGKPNICQVNTSLVITDPKGEILQSTGKLLSEAGYKVIVFNLINMANSHNYNPFNYVYDFDGKLNNSYVIKMISVLMKNTKKEGAGSGDQFWDDSATALLTAIAFLLLEEGRKSEQNFAGVMKKLKLIEVNEDKNEKSPLDLEFDALKAKKPGSLAVSYYTDFKKAPPETAMSIVMSCNVRLQAFNIPEVADLTHTDMLSLNMLGDKKTALFVIISASDTTFNFLAAMMYTQLFDSLYDRANFKFGGRLPVHVRCILDEFANIGTIPDFDKLLATMRSMEISANIIIQNISQLKKMYEKSWEIIKGNCDSFLFLGGQETSTLEEVSKSLGKETIDVKSSNKTKSHKNSSTAENNSILGRELMLPDELMRMNISKCVLTVRGYPPFFCNKFDITKHKNYKYLEDFDKKNAYIYTDIHTLKSPLEKLTEKEREKYEQSLKFDYDDEDDSTENISENIDNGDSNESNIIEQKRETIPELQKDINGSQVRREYGETVMTSETDYMEQDFEEGEFIEDSEYPEYSDYNELDHFEEDENDGENVRLYNSDEPDFDDESCIITPDSIAAGILHTANNGGKLNGGEDIKQNHKSESFEMNENENLPEAENEKETLFKNGGLNFENDTVLPEISEFGGYSYTEQTSFEDFDYSEDYNEFAS